MNRYYIKVITNDNKKIKGYFTCENEYELRKLIEKRQYKLLKYHIIKRSPIIINQKLKLIDVANTSKKMYLMLSSGMSLIKTLESIKNTNNNQRLIKAIDEIIMNINKGKSLSESFNKTKLFPSLWKKMISLSDKGGDLIEILRFLDYYYRKEAKLKKKLKSALIYPTILLIASLIIFLFIMLFIIPQFNEIFDTLETKLPILTKWLLKLSFFIKNNILYLLLGFLLIIGIVLLILKKNKILDYLLLKLPFIKKIQKALLTSQLVRSLSMLYHNGISPEIAFEEVTSSLNNHYLIKKMHIVNNEIKCGQMISSSLNTINFYPEMLIEMLKIGEESGRLDEVLFTLADYYDEEANNLLNNLSIIIEPLLIILIAIMIIILLFAIFIPLFNVMDNLIR